MQRPVMARASRGHFIGGGLNSLYDLLLFIFRKVRPPEECGLRAVAFIDYRRERIRPSHS